MGPKLASRKRLMERARESDREAIRQLASGFGYRTPRQLVFALYPLGDVPTGVFDVISDVLNDLRKEKELRDALNA